MKKMNKIMWGVLLLALAPKVFGQTNLQFTAVSQTDEQAIRLTWTSTNNEVYEIDEADALVDTNTGSVTWNVLYDNYPSQGTNTFWLDTGNYNLAPQILHPKNMAMRFYRIVDTGADTTSDEPSVAITTPTSGVAAVGDLTINVVASTDQPVLSGTKLYVDGQEMQIPDSTTNYVVGSTNFEIDTYSINTSEWGNETHTLFATAECESGYGDTINSGPIATGHAVSPLVNVLFSNLVTRISFSQASFDPSSGQTQQVSAVFAANCNWTLNIRDVYSNAVRTVTGSGSSMLYNWDGTGTGGTNIPTGIYYYYISAQTNGQAYGSMASIGSSSASPTALAPASGSANVMEFWALPPNSVAPPLPLSLYPPGMTNGFTIFAATPAEMQSLVNQMATASKPATKIKSSAFIASAGVGGSTFQSNAAGGGSSQNAQNATATPKRPPNNPVKGLSGTFAIAYDTYTANGTNDMYAPLLLDGSGAGGHIQFQGFSGTTHPPYAPLPQHKTEANNFISQMQHWGWNKIFNKPDNNLNINDLRGSGTPFNNVNLGVLILHCVYGTSVDFAANQCKQMYFPITAGGSMQYLRMSEMNLGGSGVNGLKWMAIKACHSLYHVNWNSMKNGGVKPYNSNLHLLLGSDTDCYTSYSLLQYWSKYMNYGTSTTLGSYNPLTIRAAWYQAAQDAYQKSRPPTAVTFAVAGDSACHDDLLQTNSTPAGSWFYESQQVYSP